MSAPPPPPARAVAASRVEMTKIVLPQYANALGNIFGGEVVAWIDMCAAVSAQRHARTSCVTASIDAVNFLLPIKLGHIVVLKSQVNAVFTSSMECGVSVWSEDPMTGVRSRAVTAYTTFVSVDAEGRPQPVAPLLLETDEDRRRSSEAHTRRASRVALRERLRRSG